MADPTADSGSSLSTTMTNLFMQERSVLHILKKTKHLRRLIKNLRKEMRKVAPCLAPHMPDLDGDFEHKFVTIDLFITKIHGLVRIDSPLTEAGKKVWRDLWEISDEEEQEQEEYESANEDFPREEGEPRNEEYLHTNQESSVLSLYKELVQAVTELKGAQLEDGELEEILRDLKHLPELVDVENIPEDLLVGVGEASIRERGTFVTQNDVSERKIVWPPMVIVMNTKNGKDENGKWLGMGNVDALKYFSLSNAVGSKAAYGLEGHLGMNMLIFESSAAGFMEAEILSKDFEDVGTGREGWRQSDRVLIHPSTGQSKLYGYMAKKSDVEIFNQYFIGESKLKVEMRSYQEMVVNPMKQLYDDYDLVKWYINFMNRVVKTRAYMEKYEKTLPREVQEVLRRVSKTDCQSREIVWPPVVIVFNTGLDKYKKGKRLGMTDAEVLKCINTYEVVRLQQSYGPSGHRGMCALIFKASVLGFMDAKQLCEDLEAKIKDQDGCSCPEHRVLFRRDGQRNLYGHMAEESDMEIFNEHAQGKSKLEFEMRSYLEMVVIPMKKMRQDRELLKQYRSRVAKEDKDLFKTKLCPSQPETKMCPGSPEIRLRPDSPEIRLRPDSPEIRLCPDLPEIRLCPDSPEIRLCPDSPQIRLCPDSPVIRLCPDLPEIILCPDSPEISLCPGSSGHLFGSTGGSSAHLFGSTGSREHQFRRRGSPEHQFGSTSSSGHISLGSSGSSGHISLGSTSSSGHISLGSSNSSGHISLGSIGSSGHLSGSTRSPEHLFESTSSAENKLYPSSPEQDKDVMRSYLALSKHQEEFFKNLQQEMQEWMDNPP